MEKILRLPRHKAPVLHNNATTFSFENCFKLAKTYKEIIGLRNVTHFSLNIVDNKDRMTILSYNPQIAYNIFKDGSYLYNGSISPTFYENREIYTWEEAYDPSKYHYLKNNMERKNGINQGVVLTKKIDGLILLYSFATKSDEHEFFDDIQEQKAYFYNAGDHCFELLRSLIEDHVEYTISIPNELNSNVVKLKTL